MIFPTSILAGTLSLLPLLGLVSADPGLTGDLFTDGQSGFPDPCVLKDPSSGLYYIYADQAQVAVSQTTNIRGQYNIKSGGYSLYNYDGTPHKVGDTAQAVGSPSVGYVVSVEKRFTISVPRVLASPASAPTKQRAVHLPH